VRRAAVVWFHVSMSAGFRGDFEAHITVTCGDSRLYSLAEELGLKVVHIVLERGRTPSQPMVTARSSGTLGTALAEAERIAFLLRAEGFCVTRLKIEATPWTAGVPRTDAEAAELGPGLYFEHHLKLRLDPGFDHDRLRELAIRHGGHLSRNIRRTLAHGRHERFVTQRCRLVGDGAARGRLAALGAGLRDAGFEVVAVEREFVVFDGNPLVDHGWIEEGTT
jgi:hypothetical protein